MKRSRFSEEQIITILKQAENGLPLSELLRQHGISQGTLYLYSGSPTISDLRHPLYASAWSRSADGPVRWVCM